MAKTKYAPSEQGATDDDITMHFGHSDWDSWRGTSEQLIAEGLVPKDFEWPERTQRKSFEHGEWRCCVERRRPPGSGRGSWITANYWCIDRFPKARVSHFTRNILMKKRELEEAIFQASPAGKRMFDRYMTAREDKSFQAFKAKLYGAQSS